jgi:Kef-type K+ transport system membrane component KefB
MEKKKALRFTFSVIAIILGVTLFRQFDFKNLKFENTGLSIIYAIVFVFSIYYLMKNSKNK